MPHLTSYRQVPWRSAYPLASFRVQVPGWTVRIVAALIVVCLVCQSQPLVSASPWASADEAGMREKAAMFTSHGDLPWFEQPDRSVSMGRLPVPPAEPRLLLAEPPVPSGPPNSPIQAASHWHGSAAPWAGYHEPEYADFYSTEPSVSQGSVYQPWTLQVMPLGLMYRSYLAGVKEPRFASVWSNDRDIGYIWDAALGGRLGLLRYGTHDPVFPEGWQVDLEGGSQSRLDPRAYSTPLLSVDFRVGIPVTYARGPWQFKTGYYHISAHLGDEFLLLNPDARRLNYTRDAVLLGVGYYYTERLRLYAETAYAISANDGAEPWEFQFGADWVPARDTGLQGAPFFAINGHLREEVDFGGNLVLQTGWAWRGHARGSLYRIGVQYYRGKSEQYEYYDYSERRFGWGMWADF